ncbi:MAG: DUF4845 domain-containing protein [Gammaproteobacteria bacterium]|nr:DUF4845 domain-containing protein [Gammaproteobacteria bacterium]
MLKNCFNYKKQKGFTLTGWIVIIALVLYFAYLAMIITPYLVSNNTMNRILESLKEEPGITQKSKRDIWRLIENRMIVNQVRSVKQDNFDIVKEGDTVNVYLEYDDKIKFGGNIYILIERNKEVTLVRN